MSIIQRKIQMVMEINPLLDAKIIVRKDFADDDPLDMDYRMNENFIDAYSLIEEKFESVEEGLFGCILYTEVYPCLDEPYQVVLLKSIHDEKGILISVLDSTFVAIVHVDDILEFARTSYAEDEDGEVIDPLDDERTKIFIHSMSSFPPHGLDELLIRKATIYLYVNEFILDNVIDRTWRR